MQVARSGTIVAVATVTVPDDLLSALSADAKARGLPDDADGLVRDLVELALRQQAEGAYAHDALTGCRTRSRFAKDLNAAIWGTSWQDHSLYEQRFLCVDLDNFKAYLDVHGLTAGDAVLRQIAAALREHFGDQDVCRYGGDEFVVTLRGREKWLPDVPDEVTIKHAIVDVSVRRSQRRNHHVNGWIAHHLSGAILAAAPGGHLVECRTPAWMGRGD
jgi:diguanylate cyclase (GGDEF)-like protein